MPSVSPATFLAARCTPHRSSRAFSLRQPKDGHKGRAQEQLQTLLPRPPPFHHFTRTCVCSSSFQRDGSKVRESIPAHKPKTLPCWRLLSFPRDCKCFLNSLSPSVLCSSAEAKAGCEAGDSKNAAVSHAGRISTCRAFI